MLGPSGSLLLCEDAGGEIFTSARRCLYGRPCVAVCFDHESKLNLIRQKGGRGFLLCRPRAFEGVSPGTTLPLNRQVPIPF